MALYTPGTISQLAETYGTWNHRQDDLMMRFLVRTYRTDRASEFTRHGLSRRIRGLLHCIDRTFEAVPLDGEETPSHNHLMDATAFVQSFIVNVYGAIDNLARIWCLEADVKQSNGTAVPDARIGLGPKNTVVRTSLSNDCQTYLKSTDDWFGYLENYRHALAHRIPLYIPPKTLRNGEDAEWVQLEHELADARKEHDFARYNELFAKQMSLGTFEPVMTHSYGENAKPVMLHGQMLCDFAAVIEIGERIMQELDALQS